jgi:hypothetical protein
MHTFEIFCNESVRNYEEAPPFVENLKDDKRKRMVKTDNCASLEGCSKFPQNKFCVSVDIAL